MFTAKVYKYAGPWFAPSGVKTMASKAWRSYGKEKAVEEPPSKKLGWARLNQILSGQIEANMAFNAKKKEEEEELRRKMELLKKKEKAAEEEYFRAYMVEEMEYVFPPEIKIRTEEWVRRVPEWTRETGTKVYTYDGPWHVPTARKEELQREEAEDTYDLAGNGWVFSSERCLARHLFRRLPFRH